MLEFQEVLRLYCALDLGIIPRSWGNPLGNPRDNPLGNPQGNPLDLWIFPQSSRHQLTDWWHIHNVLGHVVVYGLVIMLGHVIGHVVPRPVRDHMMCHVIVSQGHMPGSCPWSGLNWGPPGTGYLS